MPEELDDQAGGHEAHNRFWGKFRGLVVDNVDPQKLARLLVDVPAVPYSADTWAMPCVPYAGDGDAPVGLHYIPPTGAHVWVEFEGGDPSYPIWTGCYWEPDQFVLPYETEADEPPLVKVLKTANTTFMIDDKADNAGFVKLEIAGPSVEETVTMLFDDNGATFTCGKCSIAMDPKVGITLKVTDTTIAMTDDGIELKTGTITGTANQDIKLTAGAKFTVEPGSDAALTAGGKVDIEAGSNATVKAGGSMSLEPGGSGTFQSGGSMTLKAGGTMTVSGPTVNIN